jgi:glycosyltransferase involved in cell wall biosynthesis
MRIVHCVDTLEIGGLEQMVWALARIQKEAGHQVSILCTYQRGALSEKVEAQGIAVYHFDRLHSSVIRVLRKMRTTLVKLAPDVIHTHNSLTHYFALLAVAGTCKKSGRINTRHDMGLQAHANRKGYLYTIASKFTDQIVAVCGPAKIALHEAHGIDLERIIPIPNGIELSRFDPGTQVIRNELRDSIGATRDTVIVVCVGRLVALKNHAALLRVLAPSLRRRLFTLLIVGDGPEQKSLVALSESLGVSDTVRFLGARTDVPQILGASDVFAHPSVTEGYSMALVEAAAAGLPMVARDVGGNSEIVIDQVTGFLDTSTKLSGSQQAIDQLVGDAELRRRMSASAREWAQANGSLGQMHERYESLYNEVIEKRRHALHHH